MESEAVRIAQMKAILEPSQRATKMVEFLGGDPEGAVIFLHRLVRRSGGPADPNAEVLDAMVVALGSAKLAYDVRTRLYEAAINRRDTVIARLFLDASRPRSDAGELLSTLTEDRAVFPRGRAFTLGERKSMARRKRDDKLLHLLRDPHPEVVAVLLENPSMTEADILTLASRRPTLAACQDHIFASAKWRSRHRVKRALVLNPYSPAPIGLRLACCLGDLDLREVSSAPNVALLVRQHAAELLELRRDL